MAYTEYLDTVQKAYIAYYQRPAESAGLRYWAEALDKLKGDQTKMIEAFADSKESTALYGPINNDTIGNVVDAMYQALFGRKAEAAGKREYVNGFKNGKYTAGSIALDILSGAKNSDAKAIDSKLKVANQFTLLTDGSKKASDATFGTGDKFHVTYEGEADAATVRSMLSKVVSKATELSTAEIWLVAKLISDKGDPIEKDKNPTIPPPPPPSSPPPSSQTHTLTTGADSKLATTSSDVFKALLVGGAVTLNGGDTVFGQSGGSHVFDIELGATGGGLQGATVKNIQTINILGGTGTSANVVLTTAELQDVTELKNLTVGSSTAALGGTYNVTIDGGTSTVENVSVTGGADIDIKGDGNSLTTVNVQGAEGDVTIENTAATTVLNANITLAVGSTKKIKVTANAGDVTTEGGKEVEIVSGKDVSIKGSLLEDVKVTTASGKINVDHDGGAGNAVDVKTTSSTNDISIVGGKNVTTDGGKDVTIDGSDLDEITIKNSKGTINIGTTTASNTNLDKITIDTAVVDSATTHTIKGEAVDELTLKGITNAFTQTFDITNSTETTITVKADDANAVVSINSAATSATIDSAGASENSIKLNGAGVTTLTISGSTKLALNGSGLTNTSLTAVDGSSVTNGLHLKGFSNAVTSMKGGSGEDTFEVAAGSRVTLTGGHGKDTFDVSQNTAGAGSTFTTIHSVTIADINVNGDSDTIVYGGSGTGSVTTEIAWDTDVDTTLATAAANTGSIEYFIDASNSDAYIIINDTDAGLSAGDIVVKLAGINSIVSVDYNGGKITITT